MAYITLRSVKGEALSHAEMDNNFSNLNTYKIDTTNWPTFVSTTLGDINATNVGGTTAVTNVNSAVDLENWSDSTYMTSLVQTLSAGELSNNQATAIASILSAIQSQISVILSKLDSVA